MKRESYGQASLQPMKISDAVLGYTPTSSIVWSSALGVAYERGGRKEVARFVEGWIKIGSMDRYIGELVLAKGYEVGEESSFRKSYFGKGNLRWEDYFRIKHHDPRENALGGTKPLLRASVEPHENGKFEMDFVFSQRPAVSLKLNATVPQQRVYRLVTDSAGPNLSANVFHPLTGGEGVLCLEEKEVPVDAQIYLDNNVTVSGTTLLHTNWKYGWGAGRKKDGSPLGFYYAEIRQPVRGGFFPREWKNRGVALLVDGNGQEKILDRLEVSANPESMTDVRYGIWNIRGPTRVATNAGEPKDFSLNLEADPKFAEPVRAYGEGGLALREMLAEFKLESSLGNGSGNAFVEFTKTDPRFLLNGVGPYLSALLRKPNRF